MVSGALLGALCVKNVVMARFYEVREVGRRIFERRNGEDGAGVEKFRDASRLVASAIKSVSIMHVFRAAQPQAEALCSKLAVHDEKK